MDRLERFQKNIDFYDIEHDGIETAFREHKVDAVVHSATCYGRNKESRLEIFDANTWFPLRLMEAAVVRRTPLFINVDTTLPENLNEYSLSKAQFRAWGEFVAGKKQIHFSNIRAEHFYGPGDSINKFTTYVLDVCMRNEQELALTKGEQKRDFVYIDDVVAALETVLEKGLVSGPGFEEYPIGSGHAISIKDFVETVHRLTNSSTRLVFGALPYREGEAMYSCADLSAIRALGWQPKIGLEEGVRRMMESCNK